MVAFRNDSVVVKGRRVADMNETAMFFYWLQGCGVGFTLAVLLFTYAASQEHRQWHKLIRQKFAEQLQTGYAFDVIYNVETEFRRFSRFRNGEAAVLHVTEQQAELFVRPTFGKDEAVVTFQQGRTKLTLGKFFPYGGFVDWIVLEQDGQKHYLMIERFLQTKKFPNIGDLYRLLKKELQTELP